MFIKKIELTNIKAYTHKVIEFSDGVNFISGKNGAGKLLSLKVSDMLYLGSNILKKVSINR